MKSNNIFVHLMVIWSVSSLLLLLLTCRNYDSDVSLQGFQILHLGTAHHRPSSLVNFSYRIHNTNVCHAPIKKQKKFIPTSKDQYFYANSSSMFQVSLCEQNDIEWNPGPPTCPEIPDYASLSSKRGLTFLNLNIRSLLPKLDDIHQLVHEINPEIVAITESWLDDGIEDSEVNIPNYNIYRADRTINNRAHGATSHGGVALYVKSTINSSLTDLTSTSPYLETLSVKIMLPHSRPIYTCVVYGPEIRLDFFESLSTLLEELQDLAATSRTPGDIVCLGDFNCDALTTDAWEWKKLKETMSNFHLKQIIIHPTRITQNTETLLDHVWTDKPELFSDHGVFKALCF
jgi:exonuclease III